MIDVAGLDKRLEDLSVARGIEALRDLILTADDRALFRINPYAFAEQAGLTADAGVDLLLRAAGRGLFQIEWLQVCRGCGEYASSGASLCDLDSTFRCNACSRERATSLDEQVEIGFTIHPDVRVLRYAKPATLELDDYFFGYTFSTNILVRGEGVRLIDYLRERVVVLARLAAGEATTVEVDLEEGWVVGSPRAMITVAGDRVAERRDVELAFDGAAFQPRPTIAPGPVRLTVRNATDATLPTLLYFTPIVTYFDYPPYLSGQRLLNTDAFRRHLRTEVVRPGTGIPTRDNTLLFTDLRGSTALYDRIGDAPAFELVSMHLETLARVITRHAGIVVKTIGDAVMASFSRPVDAMRAALAMIVALREAATTEPLILKVGVHRGPCLIVNVRDSIDYFGQTVNIAARVQGSATGGQICFTDAVLADDQVAALLAGRELTREAATLRGVGEPVGVYRISS